MEEKNEFWLEENFITNVDEILKLIEQHKDKFLNRSNGSSYEFSTKKGTTKMYALFKDFMSKELRDAIFKTINSKHLELPPDNYSINQYLPGCHLGRHRDMDGNLKYWKSELIFLQSSKPHLKVYNEKYPEGKLIDEIPGAALHMPVNLEHEVTLIEKEEQIRYSLVLAWYLL